MKKIFIILLAALVITTACDEDTVNLEPIGYTESGFFSSEAEFQWQVNGLYHKLANFYSFQGDPGRNLTGVGLLPSDDITTRGNFGEETFKALSGGTDRVNRYFNNAYQMIQRSNTIIEYVDERGEEVYIGNPGLRFFHKGEALFFRGWAHFMLWNVYGTAPVVTNRIKELNGTDEYPGNSTGTQLLDQAIADLRAAAALLPAHGNAYTTGANLGRLTKNSAYGLAGKALVFRGTVNDAQADYTLALTYIDSISGRSLVPNYNMNFDIFYENNAESLFEYQANSSVGNVNPFLQSDDFAAIGEIGFYLGMFQQIPSWVGERFMVGTQSLYDAFAAEDPRRAHTFIASPTFDGGKANIAKYVKRVAPNSGTWPTNPAPTTAYAQGNNGRNNGIHVNNPRILRLADVMLLKAEAIVRSGGNLNTAIDIINQIRERARKSVGESPNDPVLEAIEPAARPASADANEVLEWIFAERRLELALEEGHRWWDLRRRHLAGEIDLTTWDFSSAIPADTEFQNFNINFPLPDGEVIENPNMTQNTGY